MLKRVHLGKIIYFIFIFLSIISFALTFFRGVVGDERFTISLIKHSYSQVIHLDLFDVHPPLYYLILKVFINVTTFWTKSIIIKVTFSRILSLIFFLISFYFLLKILEYFKIELNKFILGILFLVFPEIINYSTTIRMYQLAAMLIVLELYGLLCYKNNKKKGLFVSIIAIALSFYINYFTAMFSGAILIIEMISYLIKREYKESLTLFISGIIDLILFAPNFFFLYYQLKYVSSNHYSNYVGVPRLGRNMYSQILGLFTGSMGIGHISSISIGILIVIIEILSIIILFKYNQQMGFFLIKLYIATIIGLLPAIILSIVKHPMIMSRYGYPMSFIIYFMVVVTILYELKVNKSIYLKVLIIFSCLILFILSFHFIEGCITVDKPSIDDIRISREFNDNDNKTIDLNGSRAIDCSVYLTNKHKKIVSKYLPVRTILASNNKKLLLKIFNNIEYK